MASGSAAASVAGDLADAGGLVIGHRSVTPEDLVALGMVLGEATELEQ
jgi:hypothetical protein